MGKIWNSPVMNFIGNLWDCMILTFLWFVCSLPIVTIGASTTALYYCTLKMASRQEGQLFQSFFSSFKINFVQSTVAWLIILAVLVVGGYNAYYMIAYSSFFTTMMLGMMAICAVALLGTMLYLPAVIARCRDTLPRLFLRAFTFSIRYFIFTFAMLCVLALCVLAGLALTNAMWIVLVGLVAYINSYMINTVFAKNGLDLRPDMYYDERGLYQKPIERE